MSIFQWTAATAGIRIDAYSDDQDVRCDVRRCIERAPWQVRHDDIYDGDWRQACDKHLALAIIEVTESARVHHAGIRHNLPPLSVDQATNDAWIGAHRHCDHFGAKCRHGDPNYLPGQ